MGIINKIITSERGKDWTLINSIEHRFIRQRKYGHIEWLCTCKTYYARSMLTNAANRNIKSN